MLDRRSNTSKRDGGLWDSAGQFGWKVFRKVVNSDSLPTSLGSSWVRLQNLPRLQTPMVWKPRQKGMNFPSLEIDGTPFLFLCISRYWSPSIFHCSLNRGFLIGSASSGC